MRRCGDIRVLLGGWFWLALLAPALSSAQQQAQVFGESIDVRVVNVEAVVTDAKGRPVRDLKAEDFRLLVDGKEVPVEFFTEVAEGSAASHGTGETAAGETVERDYLVYIDESWAISSVRDAILEKVERDLALLGPADRMAVLAFDGERIAVLSGWTGDRAALAAALRFARERPATGNMALANQRKLEADVAWVSSAGLEDGDTNPLTNTVGRILEALEPRISPEARTQLGKTALAAAGSLRGFEAPPGRKVMLMLSAAWSMGVAPQLYGPMVEAANRLGYTVYPVDAGRSDTREVSALGRLAERTGGRVVVAARLDVLREVVADSGSYYAFGFTPAWKADDRGHRVAIEPRRPGLVVRAKSGFSDLSRKTENAMKAESVLLFGGREDDRRLIVQLGAPKRAARGQVEIQVTIGVPVGSLALTPKGKGFVAETPLAVAAMDEKGGRAELPALRLKVALDKPPAAGTYARFHTTVRLRDAGQRLVFTVHDQVNGAALWNEVAFKISQSDKTR